MSTRDPRLQFAKWAEEYGDVYSLILGTKTVIVLSSDVTIQDLLDRRSGIYSDRPEMYIGQEVCSDGLRMVMMEYGPRWRIIRMMTHNLLHLNVAQNYVPYQMLENKQMLNDLLETPADFLEHIRRYSNALTTTMILGWRTPTYAVEDLQKLFDGFSEFAAISATGAAAVPDFYPLLRLLPDALLTIRTQARALHREERKLYLGHWMKAKEQIKNGVIRRCFCIGMAQTQEKEGFSDAQAVSGRPKSSVVGSSGVILTGLSTGIRLRRLLEAGSDTTSSTMYAFMRAMLLYPNVQRHAQNEIDDAIGSSRTPNMEDEKALPYVRCLIKEMMRWMPTATLGGVPHATTAEDWYRGYRIPKGAGVINNVWTIHMHPKRAPNPFVFNPERHRDDHLSLNDSATQPDGTKRDQFTFGGGRRVCRGMHVAERSSFLGLARFLQAFDILPKTDEKGEAILPDQERLTQGFVCMPKRFPARIVLRSMERAELVRKEWKEAEEGLLDPETKQWNISPV